jgi:Na+(H+)/acetate symporter ActP
MNVQNTTTIVTGVVASAFGVAAAALFFVLGYQGHLAPEFTGAIIGGIVTGVFNVVGVHVGSTATSSASAQGASQALSTPQVTITPNPVVPPTGGASAI